MPAHSLITLRLSAMNAHAKDIVHGEHQIERIIHLIELEPSVGAGCRTIWLAQGSALSLYHLIGVGIHQVEPVAFGNQFPHLRIVIDNSSVLCGDSAVCIVYLERSFVISTHDTIVFAVFGAFRS